MGVKCEGEERSGPSICARSRCRTVDEMDRR